MIRTYRDLTYFDTFEERYEYLRLGGIVGAETFGFDRMFNQLFYRSSEWRSIRDLVIIRDKGCDLGIDGFEIHGSIFVHHMNPIYLDDIQNQTDFLLNPDFLICTTQATHNAIHYGDKTLLVTGPIVRTPNDTTPWKHNL